MLKSQLALFYFAFKIMTCSCSKDMEKGFNNLRSKTKITQIGHLGSSLDESSGLALSDDGTLWSHNDSGGQNILFKINGKGHIIDSLLVSNAINKDWEDLASDNLGHIYIADIGNNANQRKDLVIYKVSQNKTEEIKFSYADQTEFPANEKNFDCEALFWFKNELHLFTKSRVKDSLVTKHYILPDTPGEYSISPKHLFNVDAQVTAADISPDGQVFGLLTYGKIFLFGIENSAINFSKPLGCLKTRRKQTEAMVFKSPSQIIMSNEQRELFEINIEQKPLLNN